MALQRLKVGIYKGPWGKIAARHDALVDWLANAQGKSGITVRAADGALVISYSPTKPPSAQSDVAITGGGGSSLPNPVPVPNGGTNITSYSVGDILYASASTTLTRLGIGANGTFLLSNGTSPLWSNAYTEKVIGICEGGVVVNYTFLVRS